MGTVTAAPAAPGVSLRSNVLWTLAGNVTYSASQWGVFLVLARVGSVEMVGQFALAFAIASPVFLFSQLQLRSLQATDASFAEFRPGDYVTLRLAATALAWVIVSVATLCLGYRGETAEVVLLAGLARAFESLSDVLYGRLQQHEDMRSIARSLITRGLLSVLVVGLAVWKTRSAAWGAGALAMAWALVLLLHDVPCAVSAGEGYGSLSWKGSAMLRLTRAAFPLGAVTLLGSLDANIPRYFIAHDLGERALGLFAGVASLQAAGTVLVNAMGQSASPRLARYFLVGDGEKFRRLLGHLLLLAMVPGGFLIAIAVLAGDTIPRWLFGPAYGGERTLFIWLSVAVAIWLPTSVLGYAATAMRRIKLQPYALGAVALTTLIASEYAVPKIGAVGGAFAGVASAAMAFAAYSVLVLRFQ